MIRPQKLFINDLTLDDLTPPVEHACISFQLAKICHSTTRLLHPDAILPSEKAIGRRFLSDVFFFGGTDGDLDRLILLDAMEEEDWDIWDEIISQSVEDDFMSKPKSGEA